MNVTGLRIAKNTGVILISQVITWGMAILLAIFLPRYLGAEGMGKYQLANSVWAIAATVIAWGMDMLLTKEIARAPERLEKLLQTSLFIRTVFFLMGAVIVFSYARLIGYSQDTQYLIFITSLSAIFYAYASACSAALQGLEKMEYVSISEIVSKAFITMVSVSLLLIGEGVMLIALTVGIGAIISFGIQFYALHRVHPIKFTWQVTGVKWMLVDSIPFLINNWALVVYYQINVIIMSLIASETAIGWFGGAMRLFATLLFIPNASRMAVLPVMARMYTSSPENLTRLLRKNFEFMLLLAVPIGLGIFVISTPLVILLYGSEFAPSGPILAIMGLVMIFTYQNMLIGQFLISSDRQKTWSIVMVICTLITIPLGLTLIPLTTRLFQNAAIGAALSYMFTEAGMTLIGLPMLPKGTFNRSTIWLSIRIFLAGGVMAAFAWQLRNTFIVLPIAAGAIIYIMMILLLKILKKEDWEILNTMFQFVFNRFRRPRSAHTEAGD